MKNSSDGGLSLKGELQPVETVLIRCMAAIIIICMIFAIFSKLLYKQMENKEKEIEAISAEQQNEITKIGSDIDSLNSKNEAYLTLTEDLKNINDKLSNIAERKNSIPNLLNQIMYVIPEEVQLTSLENTEDKKIKIVATASEYDKLGYFLAKLKVEGILKDLISSDNQTSGGTITITIEGELP